MKNTLTLPMSRVNALAIETGKTPELAIADLLSVFYSRKMWAHIEKSKSTNATAVIVYGADVPTFPSFSLCASAALREKNKRN